MSYSRHPKWLTSLNMLNTLQPQQQIALTIKKKQKRRPFLYNNRMSPFIFTMKKKSTNQMMSPFVLPTLLQERPSTRQLSTAFFFFSF